MAKLKKILSVILCVCMVFSVCAVGASAEKETKNITSSGKDALNGLDFDVPVVFIEGIGGEFYNGASTEDESDDEQIWGPSADTIVKTIFKNIGKVLSSDRKPEVKETKKVNKIHKMKKDGNEVQNTNKRSTQKKSNKRA